MNRRDFVTQLLSVPVGVALGATLRAEKRLTFDRPADYILLDDPYATVRTTKARDDLARWYSSKIDTLVHRSLIHG